MEDEMETLKKVLGIYIYLHIFSLYGEIRIIQELFNLASSKP